ncbi:prenyltransferase/squalene oxidase repeat-containing protein [Streptomyces sp. ISL-11]|uniref:prenyltransferase/squalene oxidase repeat-containing protein n=1 Tax=Streptomyces sp. ISL-11 TaxID=2819174 RepID=UPI001BEC6A41|nr:prenyltransferase/squalene oxidase repeat-containing protein [Streptomyces sp. ISL-11]MBT2387821.1 terpene cyclase/mutase family protein [Streptomyces sp. ISL-11]
MAPSPAVHARRGAAALATAAVLSAAVAPAAFADASPSPAASGQYGTTDPRFDGVFRQSLAFVAQHAVGVTPAASAVDWLARQQCADGGFPSYRADTAKACDRRTGEFTDATAVAVQGLVAAGGRAEAVTKGLDWLKAHQNDDGGWGAFPGSGSDANSTSIALGAFASAGQDPAKAAAKNGKNPVETLLTFQLGCDAKEAERGAFSYLKDKDGLRADSLASAAAGLAVRGKGFLVDPPKKDADQPLKPLECPADAADDADRAGPKDAAGAAEAVDGYLAATLDKNGGYLLPSMFGDPAKPDQGTTADAVLVLAAGGHREAAAKPLKWLESKESGTATWAAKNPGRLAKLVLATRAAGGDPRSFGGTDLVSQLNATGPAADARPTGHDDEKKKDDDGFGIWWIVGVFFVASVGAGFLISGRRKKQQL